MGVCSWWGEGGWGGELTSRMGGNGKAVIIIATVRLLLSLLPAS